MYGSREGQRFALCASRFASRLVELSFRASRFFSRFALRRAFVSRFVSRFALSFRTSRFVELSFRVSFGASHFVELSFRVSFRYGCGNRRGIELTFKPSELGEAYHSLLDSKLNTALISKVNALELEEHYHRQVWKCCTTLVLERVSEPLNGYGYAYGASGTLYTWRH